ISITSPNATIRVRPKSCSKSARATARSASVASRTITGGKSRQSRHVHTICTCASSQLTNVSQREHRRTAGFAPNGSLDGIEMRLEIHRGSPQPVGQRLFPNENVASNFTAGVVIINLARRMQPECHDLPAVPSDVANVSAGRGANSLPIHVQIAIAFEAVHGP